MAEMAKLRELKALLDAGLISQDDFDERKQELIDRLTNAKQPSKAAASAAPPKQQQQQPQQQQQQPARPVKKEPATLQVSTAERASRRLSREVQLRRAAAPVRDWEPTVVESRSCLLHEAKAIEERVLDFCAQNNCKWVDPEFPHTPASIMRGKKVLLKNYDHWARLTENSPNPSLFVGGSGSGDVVQGEVGDCWFLGALAMVATRQDDLLYPLFVAAHPEIGFFQIRFFIDGQWRVVSVDDYVPVKRSNRYIFAHSKDENEYWVSLVEKAFAKLCGCYENIGSGNFSEAMTDLTGEGSEAVPVDPSMGENDEFWKKLEYYVSEQFLMGCSFEREDGVEHDNGMGILTGHAYGIMDCKVTKKDKVKLLHVFNPWGKMEWRGAWSDNAPEWTPALIKELNQTDEDDGMFWITYEDFCKNFNMFSVCRLLTDDFGKIWEKTLFCGEWDGENSGGCCNFSSWTRNPQMWLRVTQPTNMFFHLSRQDGRVYGRPKFTEAIGCYIFRETRDDLTRKKQHRYPNDNYCTPVFISSREYSFSALVPPGSYILIPCTFDPGQTGRFFLTVYAEDPVECGEVGFGATPKVKLERLDITKIRSLNRGDASDDEDDKKATPPPADVSRATAVQQTRATAAAPAARATAAPAPVASTSCSVCGGSLTGGGKVFRFNGNRLHVKCFRCEVCNVQLDAADFYQNEDGSCVCEDHYDGN